MTIEISDTILQQTAFTSAEIKIEIAAVLYEKNILTLEQASKLAETDQLTFQQILGRKGIEVHYGVEDFKNDIETLAKLGRIEQ